MTQNYNIYVMFTFWSVLIDKMVSKFLCDVWAITYKILKLTQFSNDFSLFKGFWKFYSHHVQYLLQAKCLKVT